MLYGAGGAGGAATDTAGAAILELLWAAVVVCLARLASVSMMFAGIAGAAGGWLLRGPPRRLGGGLPGGVVDWSTRQSTVLEREPGWGRTKQRKGKPQGHKKSNANMGYVRACPERGAFVVSDARETYS